MTRDLCEGIRSCSHCNLANATSHENQLLLHTLSCDVPFDVVFMDIWSPGDMVDKQGNTKVLASVDCMTGYALGAFLSSTIDAKTVADAALTTMSIPVGLPRLIIVDADGVFAGTFKRLFNLLNIPLLAMLRENHKAVR